MAKFCKIPVQIEAWQIPVENNDETREAPPRWLVGAVSAGVVQETDGNTFIKTLEGEMMAVPGDWIIQGVKGEIYSCKPDIFEMTYTPVED